MASPKRPKQNTRSTRKKLHAHIVSHTHWDREWYLSFESFRFHLVHLIDRLLKIFRERPDYRHFVLDGQTIVLEDYLEIRPEKRAELEGLIRDGRLVVGPWYVLPDEFLVSGESIIRNLQLGHRIAAQFGPCSRAGYVPDPFGHIAQLPQILRGFGLDNFIFLRGMPPARQIGTEFLWQAPDNESTVLALWMKNIYFNASLLGFDIGWGDPVKQQLDFDMEKAIKQLEDQVEDLAGWTRAGAVLLNNGCDHTPPQPHIPDIVTEANRRSKRAVYKHSTFDQFVEDVRSSAGRLKTLKGDLRSSCYIVVLPGVLSARFYLKQANRAAERLLERWAEPLASLASHLLGRDFKPFLDQAWKLLLQNHPHDSICGCSIDAVHREMLTRYEKCAQIATAVVDEITGEIHSRLCTTDGPEGQPVVVWDTLPNRASGIQMLELKLNGNVPRSFQLVDEEGRHVPSAVIESDDELETSYLSFNQPVRRVRVAAELDSAGLGYRTFWLSPASKAKDSGSSWANEASPSGVETDHFRLRFNKNGSFDLFDKESAVWHRELHIMEDTEDVGDEYDYSPARKSHIVTSVSAKARVKIVQKSDIHVTYAIKVRLRIPRHASPDRRSRVSTTTNLDIETHVTVYRCSRRIDMRTRFVNNARDHRVRVLFGAPTGTDTSIADGHFGVIERPIHTETTPEHDTPEPTTYPMRHFVGARKDEQAIAIIARDIHEYELVRRPRGKRWLALTLLRSVGYLSKDDLLTRPTFAGPMVSTPEAQCIGPVIYEYALTTGKPSALVDQAVKESESFVHPLGGWSVERRDGPLPTCQTFLRLSGAPCVFSAWKPAEVGDGSVLRIYNPWTRSAKVRIEMGERFSCAETCDLKEVVTGRLPGSHRSGHTIQLPRYRIQSLRVAGARRPRQSSRRSSDRRRK